MIFQVLVRKKALEAFRIIFLKGGLEQGLNGLKERMKNSIKCLKE